MFFGIENGLGAAAAATALFLANLRKFGYAPKLNESEQISEILVCKLREGDFAIGQALCVDCA